MQLAYWAILASGVMPVLTVAVAKAQRGYNNHDPRTWLESQQGYRRRADFAHRNHFEAFPFFAAAVLVALQLQVDGGKVDLLAAGFVLSRILYTVFYIADLALLRSCAWFAAYFCVLALFGLAAAKG